MARPIDYSRWDNLDSSDDSDGDVPPPRRAPPAALSSSKAATSPADEPLPGSSGAPLSKAQAAQMEEFEANRPRVPPCAAAGGRVRHATVRRLTRAAAPHARSG